MQAAVASEQMIWQGSPSQWLGVRTYLLSALGLAVIVALQAGLQVAAPADWAASKPVISLVLLAVAAVPVLAALKTYLDIRFTRYVVTSERLRTTKGIFSRRTDDIELYRVDDTFLDEPFLLRLVGRGNVVLVTSDRTSPQVLIQAIPGAPQLRDQLRKWIEVCRDRKRTRVVDMQ